MTAVAPAAPTFGRSRAKLLPNAGSITLAVVLGLLLWQLIVIWSDGWAPSLPAIAIATVDKLTESSTYAGAAITLRRMGVAFAGALLIGLVLGFSMGISKWFEAFWRPLLTIALAIPDPVYFILAILILGTGEGVGLIALTLAVSPFVIVIVSGSVAARDPGLDRMAKVYHLPRRSYYVDVVARQLVPGLFGAARTAFGFSWKIVVLMEALTQSNGIGYQIYYAFRVLRPQDMVALSLIFIVLMQVIQALLISLPEKRLLAWNA